jgi:hypothetical protein
MIFSFDVGRTLFYVKYPGTAKGKMFKIRRHFITIKALQKLYDV